METQQARFLLISEVCQLSAQEWGTNTTEAYGEGGT